MSLFFCAGNASLGIALERGRLARFGCAIYVGIEKSVQCMWTASGKRTRKNKMKALQTMQIVNECCAVVVMSEAKEA